MRYRMVIEYDGTNFCGWQSQKQGGGVQDALGDAFAKFCGQRIIPSGAGRTDAGVHARGQVAHFDLDTEHAPQKIADALNFHLKPQAVAVLQLTATSADFDARFSAQARHYLYCLVARRAPLTLDAPQAWGIPQPLNIAAMQEAATCLLGNHDFTTFRSTQCQANSPIRTLDSLTVIGRDGADADIDSGQVIEVHASARSFLHHQMRSMVGALKLVGEGRWTKRDVAASLAAKNRAACAAVAPACGLTLTQVDYPSAPAPAEPSSKIIAQ